MSEKQVMFNFLEELRKSGQINMFGAASYLQEMFDLNRYEARDIVLEWMQSFKRG